MSDRPTAYLHEITEPGSMEPMIMLSMSPDNPWSHWMAMHLDKCTYRATPLCAGDWRARALKAEAQLAAAQHELSCCDDIPLNDGLVVGISEMQSDREMLRKILVAYIKHVAENEGTDFISGDTFHGMPDGLSEAELSVLLGAREKTLCHSIVPGSNT